jgi:MFS family permease
MNQEAAVDPTAVVVTFVSSEDDQVRAAREMLRASGFTPALKLSVLAAAVGAAVMAVLVGPQLGLPGWSFVYPLFLLMMVLSVLGMILVGPLAAYKVRRHYRRDARIREPITYTFTSQGLRMESAVGTRERPWLSFLRIRETPELLLFHYGSSAAYFLPRRALRQSDEHQLKAWLAVQPGLAAELTTPSQDR